MILKDINNFSSVMRPHQKGKANVMALGSLIESLNGYSVPLIRRQYQQGHSITSRCRIPFSEIFASSSFCKSTTLRFL